MAFNRPTLDTLIKRVQADIKAGLGITTILSRSFHSVISRAVAGVAHTLHGHIDSIMVQIFPDTATGEYLLRHASKWGLSRVDATFSELELIVTGLDGKIIPIDTILQSDSEHQYKVQAEQTIVAGQAILSVKAELHGAETILEIADPVNFISPIFGIESTSNVQSITLEGADVETDEKLRERLIDRIQRPPSGGNANDYKQKSLEVPGITRAYVFPLAQGRGTVVVKCLQDGQSDIVPSSAKMTEVQQFLREWAPVTADVTVAPPAAVPLNITLKLSPNTSTVQAAVSEELKDLIARKSHVAGAWKGPGSTYTGTILLSEIRSAISNAPGEDDMDIVEINGNAPGDIVPAASEIITNGTITFQNLV